MPILAEFSEREYELAMNLELLGRGGRHSVPSQVAEKQLGYDVALVPGLAAIWPELGHSAALPGAPPGQGILSHPSAPTFAASLFLQYKRPELLRGYSAKEVEPRRAAGVNPCIPYLRYELEEGQLSRLIDLQREVNPLAEVCYVAALFTSMRELRRAQVFRGLVRSSNYLSLERVAVALSAGAERRSHVWTYTSRYEAIDGVLCSDPLKIGGYEGAELLQRLATRLEEPVELNQHLYRLAQSLERWTADHGGAPDFPGAGRFMVQAPGPVQAAASIEHLARSQGLGWFLALSSPADPA